MYPRVLAVCVALFAATPSFAQNVESFIVDNDDGYGVDTCLENGSPCGQAAANAWCNANGYKQAVKYRKAGPSDVVGRIDTPKEVALTSSHAVVIYCQK